MASLSGIASATTSYPSASQSGLKADLAKLKKEQSACINCASADTQSGKLNIQKLATQIVSLESKLTQQVQQAGAASSIDAANTSTARIDIYA